MKASLQPGRGAICFNLLVCGVCCSAWAEESVPHGFGGGVPPVPTTECISATQRQQVAANISRMTPLLRGPYPNSGDPARYPFVPIAGTEWQDRFVNNFVDLDPSGGILDWDCTDWTYDTHEGHDILLRSFAEQDIGVPVFAALDGVVTDTHDGEYDKNTARLGQPANYVVLFHGGTHYSWYWHLRQWSVAVSTGQVVRAGTQLGMAASSGNSDTPHLHFESRYNGTFYEPSAGACRSGQSYWVDQIPIRRELWLEDFAMHNTNNFPAGAFIPFNPVRTGTFVRTGSYQPIGAWYIIHNLPAGSTWRLRYLRPDGTQFYDTGDQAYGNSFARYYAWWGWYGLDPDTAGVWTLEVSVNGQVMVQAPFTVFDPGGVPTNRPPSAVAAAFDPPIPGLGDAVFCRLTVPLLEDPDYDLMSYRYEWRANGNLLRDITNAAFSDAIPRASAPPGAVLTCTVTPFDGQEFGPPVTAQTTIAGPPIALSIGPVAGGQVTIQWPQSDINYTLETSGTLVTPGSWNAVTDPAVTNQGQLFVTTAVGHDPKFFRLRWP